MKVADWVLSEDHQVPILKSYEKKLIPAGTFVKPIEYYYVPAHVKNDTRWPSFDKTTEVFCYSRYGMYPIPRNKIRTI